MIRVYSIVAAGDLNPVEVEQFARAKEATLAYLEGTIYTPTGPKTVLDTRTPLDVVASQEDAQKLLMALQKALPERVFTIQSGSYPDATEIIWHPVGKDADAP